MRGIVIRLAVVAVIIVGGLLLRDRLSGGAADLKTGDCFQVPTDFSKPISEVQHSPCNEGHTGEVFLVRTYDGATANPSDDDWDTFAATYCVPAFTSYTGLDYATDPTYDFGYFTPTLEAWNDGEHEATCYVVRIDNAPMTQSVKAATQ